MIATTTHTDPVDKVIRALNDTGHAPKRSGAGWAARCPAHNDRSPSLSIDRGDQGALLHCFAGCSPKAIASSLRLSVSDLFYRDAARTPSTRRSSPTICATSKPDPAPRIFSESYDPPELTRQRVYPYLSETGELLYEIVRYTDANGSKTFRSRRPVGDGYALTIKGVPRVLYGLARLTDALALADANGFGADQIIFVVEGEKDCERLWAEGLLAVTTAGGASGLRSAEVGQHTFTPLRGRIVVVLPDRDEAGDRYFEGFALDAHSVGARVYRMDLEGLSPHGDVSDWFDLGGCADHLINLAEGVIS